MPFAEDICRVPIVMQNLWKQSFGQIEPVWLSPANIIVLHARVNRITTYYSTIFRSEKTCKAGGWEWKGKLYCVKPVISAARAGVHIS